LPSLDERIVYAARMRCHGAGAERAASRVYLGVLSPSDVLAGALLGTAVGHLLGRRGAGRRGEARAGARGAS
jgi:hypothetical protein